MIWLSLILIIVYCIGIVTCRKIWDGIDHFELNKSIEGYPKVTVLIPARNEEENIVQCVESVMASDYPKDKLEIIVIDDHSDDNTTSLVNELSGVLLIRQKERFSGKKHAITIGVEQAKGELIICTDADSIVPDAWVKAHVQSYGQGNLLSFGPVVYTDRKYSNLLNLELSALVMLGAIYNHRGEAGMINGCNYSFSKSVFLAVDGFEGNLNLASGDDEFLLRKVHEHDQAKVKFLKTENALVRTEPPESLSEFLHQRRRWASKWKSHKDIMSKLSPILIFLFYFIIMFSWIEGALYGGYATLFFLFLLKSVSDYFYCLGYHQVYAKKVRFREALMLQIIYPIYAVFVGATSNFGKYTWRGRSYKI